jgi:hypothetical protein
MRKYPAGEESLGSRLRRPAGNLRDLAACASETILMFFFPGRIFRVLLA